MLKINKTSKGFTLLETVVAVFLVTVGIMGMFLIINRTISLAQSNSSKLIAAYLAQEGIEVIRNIRDTNWLEGEVWNNGIGTAGVSVTDNKLDYESEDFPGSNCTISFNGKLRYIGDFYTCSVGTSANDTIFSRSITIDNSTPNQLEVTVDISWTERGVPYSVSVKEILYNWK